MLSFMSKGFRYLPEPRLSAAELLEDDSFKAVIQISRPSDSYLFVLSLRRRSQPLMFFYFPFFFSFLFFKKEKAVLFHQDYSYSRIRKILEWEIKTKKKMTKKRAWKGL